MLRLSGITLAPEPGDDATTGKEGQPFSALLLLRPLPRPLVADARDSATRVRYGAHAAA